MGGKKTSTTPPKIANMSVQTSALGLSVPVGWGTARVKCNLIWYGAFRGIPKVEKKSGGKGLGGRSTGNTTYSYSASPILAICEGGPTGIAGIRTVYRDKEVLDLSRAGLSLFSGAPGQAGWGYLSSLFPSEYLNYSSTAYVAAQDYALTDSASLQNHSFEVQFAIRQSGLDDANPADILPDAVSNSAYGVPGWPSGAIGSMTDYGQYCLASDLMLSPLMDTQGSMTDFLGELAIASNTKIFFSEGLLKARPMGDMQITGNGVTWTPDLTPVYDLTEDDFETSPQKSIGDQTQAYNIVQVEYLNRANQYNTAIQTAQDLSNIRQYGRRKMDPVVLHGICDADTAQTVAQLILQNSLYQRDVYKFTLPGCFDLLEPTDLVTLTTTTDQLKLNRLLVRLTKINEGEGGRLDCEAFMVPVGMATAARYASHSGAGPGVDTGVAPGSVTSPVLFVAPPELTGFEPEIWLAAASTSPTWGGCNVHISMDGGVTYREIGQIFDPARYGVLTSSLADHADPDSATLQVNLTNSHGSLSGVSAAEMNAGGTLSWLGGEVIAYQGATLTSAYNYNLTPLRRKLSGTTSTSHPPGAVFVRLDDAIFKFSYGDMPVGDNVFVKLPSFNVYGLALEDISTATAYSITLPDASSRYSMVLDSVAAISSDSILSAGGEKQKAYIDYEGVLSDQNALDAKYVALGSPGSITSARNASATAVTALTTYLSGLSPSWTDTTVDTPIVAATYVAKWTDAGDKLALFNAAITGQPGEDAINNINLIRDPLFQKASTEWSSGVANGVMSSGFPSIDSAAGYRYYKVAGESFSGVFRFMVIRQTSSTRITCVPGQRYAFQCKVEGQSLGGTLANQYLRVHWFNSSNVLISETNLQTLGGPQTIGTLMSGFDTAPSGAVLMEFVFYADTGTTGQISALVSEPMITTALAAQTAFPPFAVGPTSGADALSVTASSSSISVPSTANGTPKAALQGFSFTAYKGTANVTATSTGTSYSITATSNLTGVTHTGNGVFTVSGIAADMGYVDVTITNGASQVIRVSYTKARDGAAYALAGDESISGPSDSTNIISSTILLLAGPNGTFGINFNGNFQAVGSSGNLEGYVEISPNGSSWTFVGNITSFGSIPGEPGSFFFNASIAGGSYGITTKSTVHVRLILAHVSSFTMSSFAGSGSVEWAD